MTTYQTKDDEYLNVTLSNNDTLKDKIHEIHNFLRNNGIGYGMTALKIFNLFYGLKKIEQNGHFEKSGLDNCCKFSNILKEFNLNVEKGNENIKKKVLPSIRSKKDKLDYMLFYLLPNTISAEVLKNLIHHIEELSEIEINLNVQLSGKIYEYFIGRDQTAISELGAYFTDRHIINYIYQDLLNPVLDDKNNVPEMIDMFGGSGGFTVGYINYLSKKYKDINWNTQIKNVNHFDMNEDVIKSAMLEFYCLTGEFPNKDNMKCVNSFDYDFLNKKYHYIVTNPPYGGDKNKKSEFVMNLEIIKRQIEADFKEKYGVKSIKALDKIDIKITQNEKNTCIQYNNICNKLKDVELDNIKKSVNLSTCHDIFKEYANKNGLSGNDKEAISLIMMMALIEKNGTAVGVLKEGIFFDPKYSGLREFLVNNFNVTKIVSIPSDQFENTETKTSILMFENTEQKTTSIEFYDLIISKDEKTSIIKNDNGIYNITTIKDRINKVHHNIVTTANINNIIDNKYSFNYKYYNKKETFCPEDYDLVKLSSLAEINPKNNNLDKKIDYNYVEIGDINNGIISNTSNYKFNDLPKGTKRTVSYNDMLISSVRPKSSKCILINTNIQKLNTYVFSGALLQIRPKEKMEHYIYSIILSKINKFEELFCNGSKYPRFSPDVLQNFEIPIPKDKNKISYWNDKISNEYNKKFNYLKKINELETLINTEINNITNSFECDEIKLKYLCDINPDTLKKNQFKEINYIDISSVKEEKINNIKKFTNEFPSRAKRIVNKNDILFSTVRPNLRGYVLVDLDMDNCIASTGFVVLRSKDISPKYIYTLLKDDKIIDYLIENSTGTKYPAVTASVFEDIKIKIPRDKNLLKDLEKNFEELQKLKKKENLIDRLYQAYMSQLINETSNNSEVNYDSDESSEKVSEISINEEDYSDEKIIIKKSKNKNKLNVNI